MVFAYGFFGQRPAGARYVSDGASPIDADWVHKSRPEGAKYIIDGCEPIVLKMVGVMDQV